MYPTYAQLVAKWSSPSIGDRRATGWVIAVIVVIVVIVVVLVIEVIAVIVVIVDIVTLKSKVWITHWLTDWQCHLLSSPGQLIMIMIMIMFFQSLGRSRASRSSRWRSVLLSLLFYLIIIQYFSMIRWHSTQALLSFLAARAALYLASWVSDWFMMINLSNRCCNARPSGQITSNFLTQVGWRLYGFR